MKICNNNFVKITGDTRSIKKDDIYNKFRGVALVHFNTYGEVLLKFNHEEDAINACMNNFILIKDRLFCVRKVIGDTYMKDVFPNSDTEMYENSENVQANSEAANQTEEEVDSDLITTAASTPTTQFDVNTDLEGIIPFPAAADINAENSESSTKSSQGQNFSD